MWCSQTERVKGMVVGATAEILEFILKFLCVQDFYLRVCVCTTCMSGVYGSPGIGVTDSWL